MDSYIWLLEDKYEYKMQQFKETAENNSKTTVNIVCIFELADIKQDNQNEN